MHESDVSKIDGRLLRLFLTVYDAGSVSRAAAALDLNQSTVSHGIERLRASLQDPLFVKSGRGIAPTDFASHFAPTAREILALLEGIDRNTSYDPAKDREAITIAANVAELIPELRRIREQVLSANHDLPVRFIELGSSGNLEMALEHGGADVAVVARPSTYPIAVNWVEYFHDPHVCYFDNAVRGPIGAIQDYRDARHAVLDFDGGRLSVVARQLRELGVERRVVLSVPSTYALGQLMTGTDLVATMRRRLHQSVFSHLNFCALPFPIGDVRFDLVWHKRAHASKKNQWIRKIALEAREG